jgi:tetratricopeptide (TPR) repeat protein/predicted Ser/Thr protein kinase
MDEETISDGPNGGDRPPPLPARIGPYLVIGRLGSGGMGEVFLAWDEKLERRVAIKRIRQDIGLSSEQRERFRREATSAAALPSHPNVVQIYHLLDDPEDAIVMEYIEGQTLAERLSRERLEMPEILRLACEIAEGLSVAHEKRLIHRDLKAANVMITDAGHAKILDFGLARPVVRGSQDPGITQQGVTLGTCYAMSPEQARGEEVDKRSDLFSFGSLFHEMLTGRPPFRGKDPLDSLCKVLSEQPVHPRQARPDLPEAAAELLLRLLEKDREKRPASAREVITILERLRTAPKGSQSVVPEGRVHDFPTADTTQLERPAPLPRSSTRRSWGRFLAVATALALLVAGAMALYRQDRPVKPLPRSDAVVTEIERRVDSGEVRRDDLARLEKIIAAHPRYVGERVLAARIANGLFVAQREPADLKRASELVREASEINPRDPRLLSVAVDIALNGNHADEAETIIERFKRVAPNDSRILSLEAKLAEKQGRIEEAESLLMDALREDASPQNRLVLANFKLRHGRVRTARRLIEMELQRDPKSVKAWELLGLLELKYGDLAQAEHIYRKLVRSAPAPPYSNLATVLVLRGRLQEAAVVYRRALDARPDHFSALANLAEVERDLGHEEQANEFDRRALGLLEKIEVENGLSTFEAMLQARCFARLGQIQKAVRIAQRQIDKSPDDPDLHYQNTLIQYLAGNRQAAVAAAKAALDNGLSRRWFEGSTFQWLRESPELRSRFQAETSPP